MQPNAPLRFSKQDLRDRAFRHQTLVGAHFEACDLRGCDFAHANLQDAQFVRCRVGRSRRGWLTIGWVLATAILMLHAVSSLVFSAMGTLPGQAAWAYIRVLYGVLAIATVSAGWRTVCRRFESVARGLLGASSAALLGFFYVGRWSGDEPTMAIGGAIVLGLAGLGLSWRGRSRGLDALLAALGAIAAYGLSFWLWTDSSSLLTTGHGLRGLGWGVIALLGIGVTLRSLTACGHALRWCGVTSFRQAHLVGCAFRQTDVTHCDMTPASRQP